jgi:hypothetical protein
MKKLVFLFAMIFAISMAMGQVTNVAETEQDGNKNDALIKQIGDDNVAESHQYGDENDARVLQTGDDNIGLADQINGNRNSADVIQEGNSNEGYLTQGMIPGYYADYGITTYNMNSNDNEGSIEQIGNFNYSDLLQVGNNNDGEASQKGNNNAAYAYQGWAGNWWGTGGQLARLYSDNSSVTIEQIQDYNFGAIWQYGGNNNEANIFQDGNHNSSSIVQGFIYSDLNYDFTYPIFNTKNNYASVKQIGNLNYGKVMQLGDNNLFKLNQTGDDNRVGYNENSSGLKDSRNAYFAQDGNNNRFAGVAKNANNDIFFNSGLDAEQFNGATLSHESYQKGDYNDIGLRQGQDDIALIKQDGNGNEALLWQEGADQNDATMLQFGNNNSSVVVQIQQ